MKIGTPCLVLFALVGALGCSSTPDDATLEDDKEAVKAFRQAELMVSKFKFKEALPFFEEALALQPDYRSCRYLYAQTLVTIGRHYGKDEEVLRTEARQLRLATPPDEAKAQEWETKADALHKEAEPYYSAALKELNILKNAWPHNSGIFFHLAMVMVYYDQLETAKAHFEQCLELESPGSALAEQLQEAIRAIDDEIIRRKFSNS